MLEAEDLRFEVGVDAQPREGRAVQGADERRAGPGHRAVVGGCAARRARPAAGGGSLSLPNGTTSRERPDPAVVTEEHVPGPETAGFRQGRSRIFPDSFTYSGTGSYCSVWSMNTGLFRGIKCDPECDLAVIDRLPAITVFHGIFLPISRSVFSLIVVVFLPDLDRLLLLDLRPA